MCLSLIVNLHLNKVIKAAFQQQSPRAFSGLKLTQSSTIHILHLELSDRTLIADTK